jgi:hypothetical protein
MRKSIMIVGLALAVAALAPASAIGKKGGTDRPVKWSATGTSTLNLATGQNSIALTGRGTHLGLFHQTEQAQVVPIAPGLLSFNSTWNAVVANGDEMSGTCAGETTTSDFVHFLVQIDCASTPGTGTGRFEDASLAMDVTVHVTRVSVEGTTAHNRVDEATGVGTISY